MHEQLRAFLDQVAGYSDEILFRPDSQARFKGDTVERRVFGCYASGDVSGGPGISSENYTKALEALDACARYHGFEGSDKSQEGVFRRYHSDHYDAKGRKEAGVWRVYLNPHPRHVAATCSRVFALASGRQQPKRFASYGGAKGAFGELVEMVKFGEAEEAFAGPPRPTDSSTPEAPSLI
jgi:hypothetical protein